MARPRTTRRATTPATNSSRASARASTRAAKHASTRLSSTESSTTGLLMTNQTHALDDPLVIDALAQALAPIDLEPKRRAMLRDRILSRADIRPSDADGAHARSSARLSEIGGFVTIAKDEGAWQPLHPGVTMKFLHDHGEAQSFLLRLAPGASIPMHSHDGDELCVVLEGTVRLNDVEGRAGTFHLALPGSGHQLVTTDNGCLLYLRANLDSGVRFGA